MPIKGNWNLGKINLPEFGLSELLGGKKGSITPTNKIYASPTVYKMPGGSSNPEYRSNLSGGSVLSDMSDRSSGGSSGGYSSKSSGGSSSDSSKKNQEDSVDRARQEQERAAEEQRRAFQAQIDSEYSSVMGELGNQESALNAQLPLTEQQISGSYGEVRPQIEYEQGQRIADLQGQQATAEAQTGGILNQARRSYNELVSGAQKFGGSAGQAYGELLGRSTAETMGTAKNALAKTITDIQGESSRVKNFYQQKLTDLSKNMNLAIEQARKDVRDQVAQINANRNQAQNWKASQNLQALANFQQNVANIRSAAETAKRAIAQWAQDRDDALNQAKQEAVGKYQISLTNAGDIAKNVASTTGGNIAQTSLGDIYGLVGKNANEVDWRNLIGNVKTTTEEDLY